MAARLFAKALALGAVALAGCFPYAISYVSLDAPGIGHRGSPCSDGAPVAATYERSGVRFEVSLEPHALSHLQQPYVKLRAPRDMAIAIPEPEATLVYESAPSQRTRIRLEGGPLDWQGPYVQRMREASPLAEYRFALVGLARIEQRGTLQLPAITANGVQVQSPPLAFVRRFYSGFAPLNC